MWLGRPNRLPWRCGTWSAPTRVVYSTSQTAGFPYTLPRGNSIHRPGRPLRRAAHPRAQYGSAWSAHFVSISVFCFCFFVSFSFFFSFLFSISFIFVFVSFSFCSDLKSSNLQFVQIWRKKIKFGNHFNSKNVQNWNLFIFKNRKIFEYCLS
jgi:hypothetical protein